jgi:hypothetical protein
MSVSRRKFVNFWTGRHRPPLVGQIEKMLAFLGGRSTLRERVAKGRKIPPASSGKGALLDRAWGAYEAWGLRTCNLLDQPTPTAQHALNCVQLAKTAESSEARDRFAHLARTWIRLAEELESIQAGTGRRRGRGRAATDRLITASGRTATMVSKRSPGATLQPGLCLSSVPELRGDPQHRDPYRNHVPTAVARPQLAAKRAPAEADHHVARTRIAIDAKGDRGKTGPAPKRFPGWPVKMIRSDRQTASAREPTLTITMSAASSWLRFVPSYGYSPQLAKGVGATNRCNIR